MRRVFYIVFGIISLLLAILGIMLPGLPTTPFLLLSVWLFTHSSPVLLHHLMSNKTLSNYVTSYKEQGGLTKKSKILSVLFMWCMVTMSIVLQIDSIIIKYLIISLALVGTFVMGFVVPTARK